MEIQKFLEDTSKGIIPLGELTSIAADRRSFGDDIIKAFTTQIELRSTAASAVLTEAEKAGRDSLLASEQRSYDASIRERDSILSLQRQVEARTEQRSFVPATQTVTRQTTDTEIPVVLDRETRCFDVMQRRGVQYAHEPGADRISLGRIVRALAFGNRSGMSDLETRVMSAGTDSAGGFTVPDIVASQFIDRMRNAMVVERAGAQMVPMTSDTLNIARLATGPTLVWHTENAAITAGDLVLERVQFIARTLPMIVKMSVELEEDSTNIDAVIERELATGLAGELDRVALRGSGTPPEPKGVRFQTGVTLQSMGANGLAPTNYDPLLDAMATVSTGNFALSSIAAIYNSRTWSRFVKLKEATTNATLVPPPDVAAMPKYLTNSIPNNLVQGSSSLATDAYVGDFSNLLIGMRTSFRLEVSRQAADATNSAFSNLQVWVRAYLRADIQLSHPEAFVAIIGIL
jgi:HK97 family phage major capsid protein